MIKKKNKGRTLGQARSNSRMRSWLAMRSMARILPALIVNDNTIRGVPACAHTIFFFQAEDGIRARNVTGVQTCALPIFESLHGSCSGGPTGSRHHHRLLRS